LGLFARTFSVRVAELLDGWTRCIWRAVGARIAAYFSLAGVIAQGHTNRLSFNDLAGVSGLTVHQATWVFRAIRRFPATGPFLDFLATKRDLGSVPASPFIKEWLWTTIGLFTAFRFTNGVLA